MTFFLCVADDHFVLPSVLDAEFSKHVYMHRALLKDDLIELFGDPTLININLNVTVIGNDGNIEDGIGEDVIREMLTIFWQLVYHSLTVGTQEKVPCIRHEPQKSQWEAIAQVIVFGVKRYSYLPTFFVTCCYSINVVWKGKYFKQFPVGIIFTLCISREKGNCSNCTW